MNKGYLAVIAIAALGASSLASANGVWTGRAGIDGGSYKFDDKITYLGCCSQPVNSTATSSESEGQYGLLLGTGLSISRFFADIGLEYLRYSKQQDTNGDGVGDTYFYRSDGLFTVGAFIGDRWSAFAGWRHATFGTGFFSEGDLGNTENGPFVGGGVTFHPGRKISLGGSAAYNWLKLSANGTTLNDVNLGGVSVKLQMSFLGTPHSIFLRWQRFDGNVSYPGDHAYEYTENYLNLGYQATFDFKAW